MSKLIYLYFFVEVMLILECISPFMIIILIIIIICKKCCAPCLSTTATDTTTTTFPTTTSVSTTTAPTSPSASSIEVEDASIQVTPSRPLCSDEKEVRKQPDRKVKKTARKSIPWH